MMTKRIFVALFLALAVLSLPSVVARADEPEPPGMMPRPDPLARPTMPANPVEADLGADVYYYVCMACHGDRGQGLSPEWLAEWGLDPKGCWESRCHASNHPPEGFVLPKYIPPVVSPVIRARFANALELHDYIQAEMPWHAPGSLSAAEYWQLTAFLARANGIDPGRQSLDPARAAALSFKTVPYPEVNRPFAWGWAVGAVGLVLGALGLTIAVKWKRTAGLNVLDS